MLVFLSACLSYLAVCLSVKLQLMIHNGNAGQLLNSRVLGVLQVITLTMTQVSVSQSQSKLSQSHLAHVLIQPSLIASNQFVRG